MSVPREIAERDKSGANNNQRILVVKAVGIPALPAAGLAARPLPHDAASIRFAASRSMRSGMAPLYTSSPKTYVGVPLIRMLAALF